jgi:hypothetical protein
LRAHPSKCILARLGLFVKPPLLLIDDFVDGWDKPCSLPQRHEDLHLTIESALGTMHVAEAEGVVAAETIAGTVDPSGSNTTASTSARRSNVGALRRTIKNVRTVEHPQRLTPGDGHHQIVDFSAGSTA